ncbi:unnamed protein product [Prunus armeniaca]|uniref:Uncharacterized protein n=1 Tax=Prunus armeniaca TaxID=36596 RepID=A0A6J5WHF0_PRUAR|nr:unnamed protein product [Prunus armeniaca]
MKSEEKGKIERNTKGIVLGVYAEKILYPPSLHLQNHLIHLCYFFIVRPPMEVGSGGDTVGGEVGGFVATTTTINKGDDDDAVQTTKKA